ncbi:alpha/beta hydrolase [bacterium]|nr:alpha/beta hydrolase [bacterium]
MDDITWSEGEGVSGCRFHGTPPYRAVAVHGGPGAPGSASTLAAGLARWLGTVEPLQSAVSVWGQVEELAGQIREHAAWPAVVFGHSWGAWLAWLLAYSRPELVEKIFLIGSGAFEARYAEQMTRRRLARLEQVEREEYLRIVKTLPESRGEAHNGLLARLGALAERADNFSVEDSPENSDELVRVDSGQYASVWAEGAQLRQEGFFVKIAPDIARPVRVLHGAYDPTPLEGVIGPIRGQVKDLRWYELDRCGHAPWKETHGRERFWRIVAAELGLTEAESS